MNEWVELPLHDIRVLFIAPGATNSQVQKKKNNSEKSSGIGATKTGPGKHRLIKHTHWSSELEKLQNPI